MTIVNCPLFIKITVLATNEGRGYIMSGVVLWIILAAVLVVIELETMQLVCLWFAVGALFAAFASYAGAPVTLQLLIFLVCSVVAFVVGRPLLVDKITPKRQAVTNVERIIGQTGTVQQEIDNAKEEGRVDAGGLSWAARSESGEAIAPGVSVTVLRIDGVKLIVRPAQPDTPKESEAQV